MAAGTFDLGMLEQMGSFDKTRATSDILRKRMVRLQRLHQGNEQLRTTLQQVEARREEALDRLTEVMSNASVVASVHAQYHQGASGEELTSTIDEATLIAHMKDPKYGLSVADRRWLLRMYPACVIASELIDWMIASGWALTRAQAVDIGRSLCQKNVIYHVPKDRSSKHKKKFADGDSFFRFQQTTLAPQKNKLWHFSPMVKMFSIGISRILAAKVENATDECDRLRFIKELRRNMLYLAFQNPNRKEWTRVRSRSKVRVYEMKQQLRHPVNKNMYLRRVVKTVASVPVSPSEFVRQILDMHQRRRWQSLYAGSRLVARLGPNTRIVHRLSSSPLGSRPRDVCVLQDCFTERRRPPRPGSERLKARRRSMRTGTSSRPGTRHERESRTSQSGYYHRAHGDPASPPSRSALSNYTSPREGKGQPLPRQSDHDDEDIRHIPETVESGASRLRVVYELSVEHQAVPALDGHVRAEVQLLLYVVRPDSRSKDRARLTIISQIDFKSRGKVPDWFVDKWAGQQTVEGYGQAAALPTIQGNKIRDAYPAPSPSPSRSPRGSVSVSHVATTSSYQPQTEFLSRSRAQSRSMARRPSALPRSGSQLQLPRPPSGQSSHSIHSIHSVHSTHSAHSTPSLLQEALSLPREDVSLQVDLAQPAVLSEGVEVSSMVGKAPEGTDGRTESGCVPPGEGEERRYEEGEADDEGTMRGQTQHEGCPPQARNRQGGAQQQGQERAPSTRKLTHPAPFRDRLKSNDNKKDKDPDPHTVRYDVSPPTHDEGLGTCSRTPTVKPTALEEQEEADAGMAVEGREVFREVLLDRHFPGPGNVQNDQVFASVGARDFEALSLLGKGDSSHIFLVKHKASGDLYAMKVLKKLTVLQGEQQAHILREQSIMRNLDHPFIVSMKFCFQTPSRLYMCMTYAAGGDLFSLLRRRGLTEEQVCVLTAELVLALRHLHSQGIVHRDVKPENVLLGADGHVRLTDFGLSSTALREGKRTFSLSGTAEYVAPEMLLSGHGAAVDWWQLGIVLHEMLTGQHPFYCANTYKMHHNILFKDPNLDPALSPEARSLVAGLLCKDPSLRLGAEPDSASDLGANDLLSESGFIHTQTRTATTNSTDTTTNGITASQPNIPTFQPKTAATNDSVNTTTTTNTNKPSVEATTGNNSVNATTTNTTSTTTINASSSIVSSVVDARPDGADTATATAITATPIPATEAPKAGHRPSERENAQDIKQTGERQGGEDSEQRPPRLEDHPFFVKHHIHWDRLLRKEVASDVAFLLGDVSSPGHSRLPSISSDVENDDVLLLG